MGPDLSSISEKSMSSGQPPLIAAGPPTMVNWITLKLCS
jgi:hypothetical protein